jgi:hypothetical protein
MASFGEGNAELTERYRPTYSDESFLILSDSYSEAQVSMEIRLDRKTDAMICSKVRRAWRSLVLDEILHFVGGHKSQRIFIFNASRREDTGPTFRILSCCSRTTVYALHGSPHSSPHVWRTAGLFESPTRLTPSCLFRGQVWDCIREGLRISVLEDARSGTRPASIIYPWPQLPVGLNPFDGPWITAVVLEDVELRRVYVPVLAVIGGEFVARQLVLLVLSLQESASPMGSWEVVSLGQLPDFTSGQRGYAVVQKLD